MLFFVFSSLLMSGQNDYSRQLEIMSQTSSMFENKKTDEALSLLRSNKDVFQIDQIAKFWYDWLNGVILYQADRYAESREYLADAIAYLEVNKNELADPNVTRFLQVYYYATDVDFRLGKDKEDVIAELEHAKYIYELASAKDNIVYSWITSDLNILKSNIADVCVAAIDNYLSGNYQLAIPQIRQILDYYNANKQTDYIHIVSWLKLLGTAYLYTGDYSNSEKYYLTALNILENNDLLKEKAYRLTLDAISVLYTQLQNFDKANLFNGKAKSLYEDALDYGDDYVRCLANGALVQNGLGYKTMAKMLNDVALRQAKTNLSDTTAISSSVIGLDEFSSQHVNKDLLDKNYFIQCRIVPYVALLSNSSAVYSDLGYFSDAIRAIEEAIKISEEYDLKEAYPYNNLATLYLYKSKFPQAAKWFSKGYSLSTTPYESDEIGFNTALSLYLCNDSTAAQFCSDYSAKMRNNIHDVFAFMSGEERAIYWKHFENYLIFANLIIHESGKNEYFGAIYDNILEAKGLLLRSTNAIRDAILNSGNSSDQADYAQLIQLKQQLEVEMDNTKRESLSLEIETIDKRLTKSVNAYSDFTSSNSINWMNVRDALKNDEVAIEFYNIPLVWGLDSIHTMDGEPRYCAVLLKREYDYPHIIPLCKESVIDELEKEDINKTDSIYRLIWQPLETELNDVRNIYFSADRELHKIGIEYAPTSDGSIIGDKYNFYRLSSTRYLAENKSKPKRENAVLYGGLKYDVDKNDLIAESRSIDYHSTSTSRAFSMDNTRYGVEYLPGTLKEVEEIAGSFTIKPRLITELKGTEESFKALAGSSIDIIHLATHGFFWTEDIADNRSYVSFLNRNTGKKQTAEDNALLRSGLFLSGANIGLKGETLPDDVEDGVLTAAELSNINLGQVDMVVMSACESGLGETSGEGVFGLQRGFKLAGANTLLMSLWKVDDSATQFLMTNFYKNYLSGKTKQESLKLAQQSLRNDPEYDNPDFWAAFILLDALN